MDYLPEIKSLSGMIFYSFCAYVISTTIAYLLSTPAYNIEDYREAVRRDRNNRKNR